MVLYLVREEKMNVRLTRVLGWVLALAPVVVFLLLVVCGCSNPAENEDELVLTYLGRVGNFWDLRISFTEDLEEYIVVVQFGLTDDEQYEPESWCTYSPPEPPFWVDNNEFLISMPWFNHYHPGKVVWVRCGIDGFTSNSICLGLPEE